MAFWREALGEELDRAAVQSARTMAVRAWTAPAVALLAGWRLGWIPALIWAVLALGTELWTWASTRDAMAGRTPTRVMRGIYYASTAVKSAVWAALPVLLWDSGSEAMRIGALVLLCGQLIHAISYTSDFRALLVVNAAFPMGALFYLPLFKSDFAPGDLVILCTGLMLMCVYWANGIRRSRAANRALNEAKQRATEANQAKSVFLATMSHELRTPMTGVLGMAQALKATPLSPDQGSQVELLIRAGDGLMAILNDILDVAKIEAGRLELEAAPFDLVELAGQAEALWRDAAEAKGLKLTCVAEADLPRWLEGDAGRIRQIMLNLLSNALKFTQAGEVKMVLRPVPGAADGQGRIEIAVSDTGIGMSEDQVARLFQAFSQADVSTARRFGGTGLGLSICRQLSEMMGGGVSVESTPGAGSTFRLTLELPLAAAPAEAADDGDAEAEGLVGIRILAAEDNPINQAVIRAILEAIGAEIEIADNGALALERLERDRFDLVLMDVHMPVMGGIEALAAIRAKGGDAPPVIALTADAMAGETQKLLALGFDDVQPKPIQPLALAEAIMRAYAAAEARRAAA
ncbi:ATP-binding protein [Phenylobacterium conjunctum]|uniref:histidine kinase n=1 Tax=Phenylobacterium conjunctum TaxID=1298959 RepID=A0ABW3T6I6_9CAUL